jgi:polygalacturonase
VAFNNIQSSGITDYENGSPTGTPSTGVPFTDLTVQQISGSVETDATPVYILCGDGSCLGWTWPTAKVTWKGQSGSKCENVDSGASC